MPPGTIYVGRPTVWGNPFYANFSPSTVQWRCMFEEKVIVLCGSKSEAQHAAANFFEKWMSSEIAEPGTWLHDFRNDTSWTGFSLAIIAKKHLRGKDLACWCPLDQPCHADVLLRLANE
jgi:hypothetical protein